MSTICKVLIADDHAILRDGIRYLITRMKNMKVVGEAVTGEEAIQKFEALRPDLLILDISLPDKNGMEVAQQILQTTPDANIIILSMYDDDEYITALSRTGRKRIRC